MRSKPLSTKGILKVAVRIYDGIVSGLMYFSSALIIFMMLCICASVFLRRTPLSFGWQLEVSEYVLILATFLGAGWLMKTGGHIRVDIVLNVLKGRAQEIYNGIVFSLVALICLLFTLSGVHTAWEAYLAGVLQIKIYTFPKWLLISIVPLGGSIIFVESVRKAFRSFAGKLVLLVDDEVDVLDALKELLPSYRTHEALDFNEASEKLKDNVYDLVVLDIMGVKGLDLLRMAVNRGYPAVMLTGHAMTPDILNESMKLGAVSFVPKEKIEDIEVFADEALTMAEEEARVNFYRRLAPYFDYKFGSDWDQGKQFQTKDG